ncbi:MAG: sigma-70 family RNA polymerase sigma factor [Planctomycetota bacterium]
MADRPHARSTWIHEALERFEGPLLHYAARLTGDAERARDVVQETFLRLCARDSGEVEERLAEWLYTVCRNLALDVRKKERPMTTTSDGHVLDGPTDAAEPAALAERRDSVRAVLGALAGLPANQQEVLRLKFQHGLSYKEISGVTELSVSNVGYLMHVGLKALRMRLGSGIDDAQSTAQSTGGTAR